MDFKRRRVVPHDLRNGEAVVVAVDIDTLQERVLAHDHMVSWGPKDGDVVPTTACTSSWLAIVTSSC